MPRIQALFRNLFRKKHVERELDDEIRSWVEMSVEQRMAEGMSEPEARRSVRLEAGGIDQLKESVRDAKLGTLVHQFVQDARHTVRLLRRSPGFAAVAILTFALGIGTNTAMFSVFDAVLLRSLPVAEPHQLFLLNEANLRSQEPVSLSGPGFERIQKILPAGSQLVGLAGPLRFNLTTQSGVSEPIFGQLVSGNYFTALGVHAALGRLLESDVAASPVAVLNHSVWTKRFGADPQVVGRELTVNGIALKIIGVAEPGFYGVSLGQPPALWLPIAMQYRIRYASNVISRNGDTRKPWLPQENLYWLQAFLRVAPPAKVASVNAALDVAFEQGLRRSGLQRDSRLILEPGGQGFTNLRMRLATPLKVLFGMVSLVLLIACANIASLLLARGAARQREFSVRLSLGASRGRLLRQLLTENLALSVIGGALGLLLVMWALPAMPRLFGIPAVLQLDQRLLLFTVAVSLATGLLFGSVPALRAISSNTFRGGTRHTLGKGLVISQIALSFLLVTGATLLGRSMLNLLQTNLGFDRRHIVTVVLDTESAGLTNKQLPALYDRLLVQVRAVPGVHDATISLSSLAGGGEQSGDITVPGYTAPASERPHISENFVASGYFGIVGMHLLQGRDFNGHDSANAPPVAIVNEVFARRYLAGLRPVGRRFGYSAGHSGFEIIGVVADARTASPKLSAQPMAYYPLNQQMQFAHSLEVRTAGDPSLLIPQLRCAVSTAAPNLPVIEVTTLAERVDRTVDQERLVAQLTSLFALLALLLACIGIYGLLSYRVARRTAEFGIRMALGAHRIDIVWIVLIESSLMLAGGLGLGLVLTLAGSRMIDSLLFGLTSTDPFTFLLAALLLSIVTILSAYLPARKAAHVDPSVALRHD